MATDFDYLHDYDYLTIFQGGRKSVKNGLCLSDLTKSKMDGNIERPVNLIQFEPNIDLNHSKPEPRLILRIMKESQKRMCKMASTVLTRKNNVAKMLALHVEFETNYYSSEETN